MRKLSTMAFLASWLLFLFAVVQNSTDFYEFSPLAGILPFYLLSMACFCVFFVTWRGRLVTLAFISAFYQAFMVGLPFLRYHFLFGTVYDNMHHYALAESMLATGHVSPLDPYYGFTAFHGMAVSLSLLTGLPLETTFRGVLAILPAMVQLAAFWLSTRVMKSPRIQRFSILSGMIVFAVTDVAGPVLAAWFLVVLILALALDFALPGSEISGQGFMMVLTFLAVGLILTHPQTSFFAMFDLVGAGLLVGLLREPLKTSGVVGPRLVILGVIMLGVMYLWWTYYSGFVDTVRFVFSIVSEESISLPGTFAGRGIFYYGPVVWAIRTLFLYPQRGQIFFWGGLGILITPLTLLGKVRREAISFEAQAIALLHQSIFLGLWAVFLFIPFFFIGGVRFLLFAFLLVTPFMAISMDSFYSWLSKSTRLARLGVGKAMRSWKWRSFLTFLLLFLIFVDYTSPFIIERIAGASSLYQHQQMAFLDAHDIPGPTIITHLVIDNQLPPFAPHVDVSYIRVRTVEALYSLVAFRIIPYFAQGSIILLQKIGPAGDYFEPVNLYTNNSWVTPGVNLALNYPGDSIIYNSGEDFIIWVWKAGPVS